MNLLGLSATVPNIDEIARWIRSIHHRPLKIVKEAQKEVEHSIRWGYDAAIFMAAMTTKTPIEVIYVPAEIMRDRSQEKIAKQLEDNLAIYCAADRLYDLSDNLPHHE